MKKYIKILLDVICIGLILCLLFFIFSSFKARSDSNHVPGIGIFKFMYVLTGSMSPKIMPGDMIVIKTVDEKALKQGDIITFRISDNTLVTHRIVGINNDGSFITKGDANNVEDIDLKAHGGNIIGKYFLKIPKGGYVLKFIQSPIGIILFILIPVIVLTWGEVTKVFKEIDENEKKAKKDEDDDIGV